MKHAGRLLLVMSLMVLILPGASDAQNIQITPFGGYFFGGKMAVREGDMNIKNEANYGVTIDFGIRRDIEIELMYNRSDTRLVIKEYPSGFNTDLFDMSVNYFHLGGIYRMKEMDKGYMFTNFSLGATLFAPSDADYEDECFME